jgi:hypothetical protein
MRVKVVSDCSCKIEAGFKTAGFEIIFIHIPFTSLRQPVDECDASTRFTSDNCDSWKRQCASSNQTYSEGRIDIHREALYVAF